MVFSSRDLTKRVGASLRDSLTLPGGGPSWIAIVVNKDGPARIAIVPRLFPRVGGN